MLRISERLFGVLTNLTFVVKTLDIRKAGVQETFQRMSTAFTGEGEPLQMPG